MLGQPRLLPRLATPFVDAEVPAAKAGCPEGWPGWILDGFPEGKPEVGPEILP